MAYATYTTDAIVCGSRPSMTSDSSYRLFTREAGMVWASARSVREERSRQRYALQDFSVLRVSLVKGKGGWRIGSVQSTANPFLRTESRAVRGTAVQLIKLVRRYVHGEQALPAVFDDLAAAFVLLETETERDRLRTLEQVFTLRLLFTLGYVEQTATITSLLTPSDIGAACAVYDEALGTAIAGLIDTAATVSHL